MDRNEMLRRVRAHSGPWDMIIVGGGATGVGVAIDAATRGYDVLLLERGDFGKGTSSRSTKLVHGGVRYLEQGNVSLVMEALKERGLLARNAPHMVKNLAFVVPTYDWWESPFYGIGLKLYDMLAGKYGFGASRLLSREQTLERLPTINTEGLRGGVVYYDGQFDDARLLIHMVFTAANHGATLVNYADVAGVVADSDGFVGGVEFLDTETGESHEVRGRVVINATGPFTDALRSKAEPGVAPIIAPSQGIHLVFDSSFLPGDSAIMVPHTSDKRILFAIPWHGHTVVGTTDTPIPAAVEEPVATEREIEFVLSTAALYLAKKPPRSDVLSVFCGIRPLVKAGDAGNTAALSRDHTIRIENSGMITICGGKWTTYRRMAEDCVDQAATLARLPDRPCVTETLPVHASDPLPASARLHAALPYTEAHVIRAAREEMARTVEDVLARRTRALFLNTEAALKMAPRVAELLEAETGRDPELGGFQKIAGSYRVPASSARPA
jgi:glycerol-3-phosphate dehydrogenase